MHYVGFLFAATSALILSVVPAVAEDVDEPDMESRWRHWEPAVFEQASREGKLVVLDLVAEWCTFCKKMNATTWRDPAVITAIDADYVPVRADPDKDQGLPGHFSGYARPSTVILSADGDELFRKTGYLAPQWMLWTLQGIALEHGIGQP